jgi:hypothetical protein
MGMKDNSQQRFLIAKYASDVRRMEPHNIGIILWSRGKIACRFLSDCQIPFVGDTITYNRWVSFWSLISSGSTIKAPGQSEMSKKDPASLDAIRKTQSGNYFLFDGGHVIDDIPKSSIQDVADFLFSSLVAAPARASSIEDTTKEGLGIIANRLLAETGITGREDYQKDYKLEIEDVEIPITFDGALANSHPSALFHNVRLGGEKSITSAACMFDLARKKLPKENMVALVSVDAMSEGDSTEASSAIRFIAHRATVINVAHEETARQQILRAAMPVRRLDY